MYSIQGTCNRCDLRESVIQHIYTCIPSSVSMSMTNYKSFFQNQSGIHKFIRTTWEQWEQFKNEIKVSWIRKKIIFEKINQMLHVVNLIHTFNS